MKLYPVKSTSYILKNRGKSKTDLISNYQSRLLTPPFPTEQEKYEKQARIH